MSLYPLFLFVLLFKRRSVTFYWLQGHNFGHLAGFSHQYRLHHEFTFKKNDLLVAIRPQFAPQNPALLKLITSNSNSVSFFLGYLAFYCSKIMPTKMVSFLGEKDPKWRRCCAYSLLVIKISTPFGMILTMLQVIS